MSKQWVWTTLMAMGLLGCSANVPQAQEQKMSMADCPAVVQETVKEHAGNATVVDILKDSDGDFQVTIKKEDNTQHYFCVAEDGKIIEEEIPLKDCPPAIQMTIKKTAGNSAVVAIYKETDENGVVGYCVTVESEGGNSIFSIAADGTLMDEYGGKEIEGDMDAAK